MPAPISDQTPFTDNVKAYGYGPRDKEYADMNDLQGILVFRRRLVGDKET